MIKVIVCGVGGKMGARIAALVQESKDLSLLGGVESRTSPVVGTPIGETVCTSHLNESIEKASVIIDFTQPEGTLKNLSIVVQHQKPIVIGTTGFSEKEKKEIEKASKKIPICLASNMSVGVNVLFKLISEAVHLLGDEYDVEVIEAHHNQKKDAPSGTAKSIGEVLLKAYSKLGLKRHLRMERNGADCKRDPKEIGIQTIRAGDIVGDHTVLFASTGERLEIKHQATSRDLFAKGAIRAARWLVKQKPGLYDMQDVLGLK